MVGLILLTVIGAMLPLVGPFLFGLWVLGYYLAGWLIFPIALTLAAVLCLITHGVLAVCGVSRGWAWKVSLTLVFGPMVVLGLSVLLMPTEDQRYHSTVGHAHEIQLSDLRLVRGVPECAGVCAAGMLVNKGTEPVSTVSLALDFQDAAGRSLGGRIITPVSWTPKGRIIPGGSATFLYSPRVGLLGINPRLSRVTGEVVGAEIADHSTPVVAQALTRWIFHGPGRLRQEWYTPEETIRYARQVAVTAVLEPSAGQHYAVKGVVHNGGDLPVLDVSVGLSLIDARGHTVGGRIVEPVTSRYASQTEPLTPGSDREFAVELEANYGVPALPPVTLQTTLSGINLGRKNQAH
jgi:hypothetical protein